MIDFRSTEQFDLKPSNADAFSECIDKISKSYAYYGMILRFPTTFLPDAAGAYILSDHANSLETWNQIGLDVVLNNANMTWVDKTFTDVTPHKIQDITTDRGEVTAGVCGTRNDKGKALFLNHWRSAMLAHHCFAHFTEGWRQAIKTQVDSYYYFNATTGETAYDCPTVLALILCTMRPNVRVNVFCEIASMKDVTLESCNNNVVEWISQMEIKRINIKLNILGAYDDNQFLIDIYQGAL